MKKNILRHNSGFSLTMTSSVYSVGLGHGLDLGHVPGHGTRRAQDLVHVGVSENKGPNIVPQIVGSLL